MSSGQLEASERGRYFCEGCLTRYDVDLGDCPGCPAEPLLDLTDRGVVEMLHQFDDRAWRDRLGKVTAVCAVLCSPALLLGLIANVLALPAFGFLTLAVSAVVYPLFKVTPRTPADVRNGPMVAARGRRRR